MQNTRTVDRLLIGFLRIWARKNQASLEGKLTALANLGNAMIIEHHPYVSAKKHSFIIPSYRSIGLDCWSCLGVGREI